MRRQERNAGFRTCSRARRAKLERLREQGIDPFPHALPRRDARRRGAQRLGRARAGGGDRRTLTASRAASPPAAARARWRSWTSSTARGRIQLQARADVLGEEPMAPLLDLDLGDLVGVDGTIFRSRRGELTLRVDDFTMLAKSLRPPPDKHHGLHDVETRYRRRELDLIGQRGDPRELFVTRAKVDLRAAPLPRRRTASSRSRPRPPAALRRRPRAAVRDAPQPA